jgi:hypothetical protein
MLEPGINSERLREIFLQVAPGTWIIADKYDAVILGTSPKDSLEALQNAKDAHPELTHDRIVVLWKSEAGKEQRMPTPETESKRSLSS